MKKLDRFLFRNIWIGRFMYFMYLILPKDYNYISDYSSKFSFFIRKLIILFYLKWLFILLKYRYFLDTLHWALKLRLKEVRSKTKKSDFINKYIKLSRYSYIQKGYKYKNLGIYLKNLVYNNNDLYFQKLKNSYKFYCYLLIRLNRKNLFLTLLNNEGNVLCKTNIGASGFKKKVKRTGYAIKGTGKNFIKKIKKSLIKNIFILYKRDLKNIDYNFQNKIKNLKLIKNNKLKKRNNIKRRKIKNKKKNNKKYKKLNILKKISKKIIRSKLLWIKILNNLKKYRIYYYPNLNNLIKKNLRIIFRIKTSLKLWAFRFVVYGLFKKLPWFRGIEFRLPIAHSNSLRLKKKRRV